MATHISASQVGALMGVSPWMSPLQLFHRLRGEIPPVEEDEVLEEGREFEDAIFRIGCRKFGMDPHPSFKPGEEWRENILSGHPDRVAVDRANGMSHVVEIKHTLFGRAGGLKWGQPYTDQVSPHYRLQAMVYQWMLKGRVQANVSDHAKLFARLDEGVTCYEIPIVGAEIMAIQEAAREMLERVARNDPPPALAGNEADQRLRWLAKTGKRHVASRGLVEKLETLGVCAKERKELEKRESEIKAEILAEIEDAEEIVVVDDNFNQSLIATAKANARFDAKAFAADHGDLIARYQIQEVDWSQLKKDHSGLVGRYMKAPTSALEQTRVIRLKGAK